VAVAPRPAATVVLLRDGRDGPEAYLQRRPMHLGFAGGLWVFPGGRVDEADRDPAVDASWTGPSPATWAERLGLPLAEARGHVVAACRETLEEAGLLLAEPAPGAKQLADARRELLAGALGFAELLAGLGVRLDADRLRYWAWWVTPEAETRRYDTRFFVAGLPADAAVTAHPAEVERERWLPVAAAADDQSLPMLPPTRYSLRDLAGFASVAEALAAGGDRPVERILPVLDGANLVMPWLERYPVPFPVRERGSPPVEAGGSGGLRERSGSPPVEAGGLRERSGSPSVGSGGSGGVRERSGSPPVDR
jgi:8-oxo-dGTP pyrophosphatase MutT (NUDIX family)